MDEPDWRARQAAHRARVLPWIQPRLARKSVGDQHPVDDFLFDYYPYSTARLSAWHPGWGVTLEGGVHEFLEQPGYRAQGSGATLTDGGLAKRAGRLGRARAILEATADRAPQFSCFGMHEWAMVHRLGADDLRHASHRLRLTQDEIAEVVHGVGLRCTHFDAYRFFTSEAIPLNLTVLTREAQVQDEQPGCVHAAMDLYKYAMWAYPYLPSELVADCFALARSARELDMQASPYDLIDLGYAPITVETADGRVEYSRRQRELAATAAILRARLLSSLDLLTAAAEDLGKAAAPVVQNGQPQFAAAP
ncbi:MAG: 3-methyladenine DNA glycosylase [Candidatus Nanopelagicales bacterium]|nr:3-methyladenine DNA glycosylase [Candidatus Nanopelagicales bacterium]